MSKRRVGFCLSDKKRRKMNLLAFAELCATHGLEVIEIDLTQPLASQGPFDVIVHKLSDVIVEAEYDSQSQQLLTNFQSYVSAHPSVFLLDPLPAMMQLLDRFASYRIMSKLHHALRDWCVCSPSYLEVRSSSQMSDLQQTVQRKGLSFPLVCKTRVAHGSRSHEMCLIFCPAGLCDVRPPCVLQSFVNHGAVLHKVFVVGDAHFTVERPSLKNFPPGPCERETIFFNSHEVSKPESCSDLTALDEKMPLLPPPSAQAVGALVAELRAQLGMALFGVDVILNIHTHTLTVIDINIFPGYEGVPQFFSLLLSHIESVLDSREDPQAAGLPASQAAGLPASQAAGLPASQAAGLPAPQAAGLPASQAAGLPAPQAVGLPASQAAGLPASQAAGLPASQAAGLPASQAAGLPASQAAGLPASQAAGPLDPQTEPHDLGYCDPQGPANPPPHASCSTSPPSPQTTL